MRVYLASPGSQIHAQWCGGMPVLLSFSAWRDFLADWVPTFDRLLLDSGAFSEMNSGVAIDLGAYVEWANRFGWADAWAGLDDISGDWRRSLRNYDAGGFPTIHDSDPPGLLEDLVAMARERGGWIGVGLVPPRSGKERWMRETLEAIPGGLHVHGWACGLYTHLPRLDSVDSTHWWREAMKYRTLLPWLSYAEALEIAVKKVKRLPRRIDGAATLPLFGRDGASGDT